MLLGVTMVVVAGGVTAAVVGFGGTGDATAARSALPPATATVTVATLVQHAEVDGTLGYGEPVELAAAGGGTITWLPEVGDVVKRGQPLYRVNERPVILLYGSLPAYRQLTVGVEGADVEQLEKNLEQLGYTGFTVDRYYTDGTAAAVASWQQDTGQDETSVVEPGQVSYAGGALRIADLPARLGGQAGGPVLRCTGTTRQVSVDLDVKDQSLAGVDAEVGVTLPDGATVTGTVASVGTAATSTSDETAGPGESATATVKVTVAVEDQDALGDLDEAPVTVELVSEERADVLAVPITALLALREGGYGVELVDGRTSQIVAVDVGMFADGLVEVSGDGITDGAKVGVPE